jgi:hypothetical protein
MSPLRTLIALTFAAALVGCNQQNAAKSEAPADAAATSETAAAPASGDGGKPDEPEQAPAGAAPDKPD